MQNPINDWNAEFQVPLAENLELLNLFPRAFPLKNGKAWGRGWKLLGTRKSGIHGMEPRI